MGEQRPGHAEVVEGDVGQCDVLLEFRPAADPLPEPLRHHEVVVGVPQNVFQMGVSLGTGVPWGASDDLTKSC